MTPDLDDVGPAAPPRENGELVFEEAWQSRLFATTMAACEADLISYDRFRERLIQAISADDEIGVEDYWAAWLDAFETVAIDVGLVDRTELADRATAFAAHD